MNARLSSLANEPDCFAELRTGKAHHEELETRMTSWNLERTQAKCTGTGCPSAAFKARKVG
jgi:hypothetical protein